MAWNPFRYFKTSPEIIHLGVFLYVRFPLSLRNVGDLLHERGKAAALKFLKKAMKRHGKTHVVVTDKCPSYRAAMKGIGNEGRQCTITSTSKGIPTPELGSNKSAIPRFVSGATFSSPDTCASANE